MNTTYFMLSGYDEVATFTLLAVALSFTELKNKLKKEKKWK